MSNAREQSISAGEGSMVWRQEPSFPTMYQCVSGGDKTPKDAGLTFDEALAYEAKEYRKAYYGDLTKDYEPTKETIEWYARQLAKSFSALSELYGEKP